MAERDISAGEEICISYLPCLDVEVRPEAATPEALRRHLLEKWGILCPPDCTCRNKDLMAMVRRAQALDRKLAQEGQVGAAIPAPQQVCFVGFL